MNVSRQLKSVKSCKNLLIGYNENNQSYQLQELEMLESKWLS